MWARLEGGSKEVVAVGFSDHGQSSLGDILSLQLPNESATVTRGSAVGWADSYRRAADIVSPVKKSSVALPTPTSRVRK